MHTTGMTRIMRRFLALFAGAMPLTTPALARPTVWMFPPSTNNGQELRDLFGNPGAWPQTRSRIDGIAYADQPLRHQFSDAEQQVFFAQMAKWRLKLGLEAGAIKEWGPTAEQSFPKGARAWDRLIANGAHIDSIAMDEPFFFSQRKLNQPLDYAVEQTARFVSFVRQRYPTTAIGDVEPFPALSAADLLAFIDGVQARLHGWHLRGLDFVRLDVDWMHFVNGDRAGQGGWASVRAVEAAIHQRGLPFSLIYWAADFPSLAASGQANDETWEQGIMDEGARYAATGAMPDDIMIESWLKLNNPAVPETDAGTFTRSVLDFTNRFVPGVSTR